MKRVLACILFLVIVLCVGCGGSENGITATETPETKVAIEPDESDLLDPLGYVEVGMIGMNEAEAMEYDSGLTVDENGDLSRGIRGTEYFTGVVVRSDEDGVVVEIAYEYGVGTTGVLLDLLEVKYGTVSSATGYRLDLDSDEPILLGGIGNVFADSEDYNRIMDGIDNREKGTYHISFSWDTEDITENIDVDFNFDTEIIDEGVIKESSVSVVYQDRNYMLEQYMSE